MVFRWYYFSVYEREDMKQETVFPYNCVLWVGGISWCYPTIQIQHFVHRCHFFKVTCRFNQSRPLIAIVAIQKSSLGFY